MSMDNTYQRNEIYAMPMSARIQKLKQKVLSEPRCISTEQACIITEVYKSCEGESAAKKRALSFAESARRIGIKIYPEEDIVGNRTAASRAGVIFPESGTKWLKEELDTLATRDQDRFIVKKEDYDNCRNIIEPYWNGRDTLENVILREYGGQMSVIGKVVKINQTDHAQGHICPDTRQWILKGPAGLCEEAKAKLEAKADTAKKIFYSSLILVLEAASRFRSSCAK